MRAVRRLPLRRRQLGVRRRAVQAVAVPALRDGLRDDVHARARRRRPLPHDRLSAQLRQVAHAPQGVVRDRRHLGRDADGQPADAAHLPRQAVPGDGRRVRVPVLLLRRRGQGDRAPSLPAVLRPHVRAAAVRHHDALPPRAALLTSQRRQLIGARQGASRQPGDADADVDAAGRAHAARDAHPRRRRRRLRRLLAAAARAPPLLLLHRAAAVARLRGVARTLSLPRLRQQLHEPDHLQLRQSRLPAQLPVDLRRQVSVVRAQADDDAVGARGAADDGRARDGTRVRRRVT